jgi:hypothetical protein
MVAGSEIEPGMTILFEPGVPPFIVAEINTVGYAGGWRRVDDADGEMDFITDSFRYEVVVS